MLRLLLSLSILLSTAVANPAPAPAPAPTPAPEYTPADLARRETTSYYSVVTTQIPADRFSIGMGQNGTGGDYYWAYCIDQPLTVTRSFGGCGSNDVYTRCSGRTLYGLDRSNVLCDFDCMTHKIYKDLDASSFTPFLGCAGNSRQTAGLDLLRTSTSSGTTSASKGTASCTATPGATNNCTSLGLALRPEFSMALAGLLGWVFFGVL
ncbi:hypothetical protein BJ875DRAFT_126266 [Amylocarpus encephaloides]|uniref:WSC domain-containing protein n=1 Tax=Amylocarpus encephaloides TaxID=45428 RepID=A0A9P7YD41_9HELO|nr:hypothetical protein BJ875DRAFT_126266 [Amylocarpus encephaloides]